MNPKEAANHFNLGAALFDAGKVDEAIAAIPHEALELNPEYAEAHTNLGAALARKRQAGGGRRPFHQGAGAEPGADQCAQQSGNGSGADGTERRKASPYLRDAVAEKPQDAEAQTNLGLALAMARQFDEAIAHLQAAVAASPDGFRIPVQSGPDPGGGRAFRGGDSAVRAGGPAVGRAGAADPGYAGRRLRRDWPVSGGGGGGAARAGSGGGRRTIPNSSMR